MSPQLTPQGTSPHCRLLGVYPLPDSRPNLGQDSFPPQVQILRPRKGRIWITRATQKNGPRIRTQLMPWGPPSWGCYHNAGKNLPLSPTWASPSEQTLALCFTLKLILNRPQGCSPLCHLINIFWRLYCRNDCALKPSPEGALHLAHITDSR